MPRARRTCEIVHLTILAVWLGSLVMTGVTVAILFPTIKTLAPTLPEYSGYAGDHWRLAAGQVAARFFLASDMIQFGALLAAGITFGLAALVLGLPMRRASTAIRGSLLVLLIAVLSYQFFVLSADMNADLRRYWDAARAGDTPAAEKFRAAFESAHPLATRLLAADTLLVLLLLISGLVAVSAPPPRPEEETPALEIPILARKLH